MKYDVIQIVWGACADYDKLPEQFKQKRVMCTCRTRQSAMSMLSMYSKGLHSYEIVER